MLFLIIIAIIVIIAIAIQIYIDEYNNWFVRTVVGLGVGFITAVVCFVILCAILLIVDGSIDRPVKYSEKSSIVCLSDNLTTKGSFFLGCGQIDGKFKYAYYVKTDIGYKLKTCDASSATIVYSDKSPYVDRIYKCLSKDSFWYDYVCEKKLKQIIIYVPKGSILNDYQLDAR